MSEKIVVDANAYLHENVEPTSGLEDGSKNFLANSNPFEIAKVFSEFSRDNRVLVIPVGFPQAGKSLFLSSLMYYARNYADNVAAKAAGLSNGDLYHTAGVLKIVYAA